MRFATWNLSHAVKRSGRRRSLAWKHLASLGVDVAMVQEAGLPIHEVTRSISAKNPDKRDWGTAVVTYGPALSELNHVRSKLRRDVAFPIPDAARPGTLAIAVVDVPGLLPIIAVSLYGKLRYAAQSVLRAASDLLPIFDSRLGRRVILAGDLNMHTASMNAVERARTVAVLGFLEALGLKDLVREAKTKGVLTQSAAPCPCEFQPCSHVRTHRHPRHSTRAVGNCDYMYATDEMAKRLESLVIMNGDHDPAWNHSDHAPMIAKIRL